MSNARPEPGVFYSLSSDFRSDPGPTLEVIPKRKAPQNERLMRQLRQVEKLPPRARQSVLEHIEALASKYGSGE